MLDVRPLVNTALPLLQIAHVTEREDYLVILCIAAYLLQLQPALVP
jgi:hypothetical protein